MPPTVLITGFGPFPGIDSNPSATVMERLRLEGHEAHVLPTEYGAGLALMESLLVKIDPDIVLCFGVAGDAERIRLERLARNTVSTERPDAAGDSPVDGAVEKGGPYVIGSTLPLEAIARALQARDIPWEWSDNAGDYLCNYMFYRVMRYLAACAKPAEAGFIHIPNEDAPGFSMDRLVEAARVVVDTVTSGYIFPMEAC